MIGHLKSSPVWILFTRELRGKKKLMFTSAIMLFLSTATLTLVLALSHSFEITSNRQAKAINGGDFSIRLSAREFNSQERQWLEKNSESHSYVRTMRILSIAGERTQLARFKGVDEFYPLVGNLILKNPVEDFRTELLSPSFEDGTYPAYIGENFSRLLDLDIGDTFIAGGIRLRIMNIVLSEPDPDQRFWATGPLIMISKSVLEQEQFTQPGALISRYIRVLLPTDTPANEWLKQLNTQFPDEGWRIYNSADNRLSNQDVIERVRQFLSLASLAAILLTAIGCGNTLSSFLYSRLKAIAIFKMVGCTSQFIRYTYFLVIALFVGIGAALGVILGKTLLFIVNPVISSYLPVTLETEWSWAVSLRSFLTVVILSSIFVIPPILRFSSVSPLALFSNNNNISSLVPQKSRDNLLIVGALLFAIVILPLDYQAKIMLVGVIFIAILIYAISWGMLHLVKLYSPLINNPDWRLGLLAVTKNRRQTILGSLSFGIGIFILSAVLNTENNFSNRINDTLKQQAPAAYLIGIRPQQLKNLQQLISIHQGSLQTIPYVRGRINSLDDRSASTLLKTAPENKRWILRGDRGITWTDGDYIGNSRVVKGELWDSSVEGLQASFAKDAATAFDVDIGDTVEMNILGEPVLAKITSLREVDWQSFDINFVVILSAPPFSEIPHTLLGATRLPPHELPPLQLKIASQLPNIVPINTSQIFSLAQTILMYAATLLQLTAVFILLTGIPMIFSILLEARQKRLNDTISLRLLGAPQRTIITAGIIEFSMIALASIIPATLLGVFAGKVLVEEIFSLPWQLHPENLLLIVISSLVMFFTIGILDIRHTLSYPPLSILRNQ